MGEISCKILLILILTHNYYVKMFNNKLSWFFSDLPPVLCVIEKNEVLSVPVPAPADGLSSLEIDWVDVVSVGIPYGFQCTAECYPDCRDSWTRGNETTQGPEMSLQLLQRVPTQTLTCTVVNPATGRSASVQKTLQVTGMNDHSEFKVMTSPSAAHSLTKSIFLSWTIKHTDQRSSLSDCRCCIHLYLVS